MRGLSICQSRPCRIEPFEPGDGDARKYAILARRGNDILKLLRPVGLSKCTAFGHDVRTGTGWNGIRRAFCHSFFAVRRAPFRRKTSRNGMSFFCFQGFFPPACREGCSAMRTKKCFLSRTKNHSAAIEMRLDWKKAKNKVETWIYVSKKGQKWYGT